jgi:hypothetical protein
MRHLKKRLPNKLSKLIRVAVKDLDTVSRKPGYRVAMGYWHQPLIDSTGRASTNRVCCVCLAGAVIAQRSSVRRMTKVEPSQFDVPVYTKLRALNFLRCGEIADACRAVGIKRPKGVSIARFVSPYEYVPALFYKDMEKLAKYLEKHGL